MPLRNQFALPDIAREGLTPPELELLAWVQAWFRKRCFWVTQASGIIPLFKAELFGNAILLEIVDLH
jgi:hypothetical protein